MKLYIEMIFFCSGKGDEFMIYNIYISQAICVSIFFCTKMLGVLGQWWVFSNVKILQQQKIQQLKIEKNDEFWYCTLFTCLWAFWGIDHDKNRIFLASVFGMCFFLGTEM